MNNWSPPFQVYLAGRGTIRSNQYHLQTLPQGSVPRLLFKLTLKGHGVLLYQGQRFDLEAGDLFLIDRIQTHEYFYETQHAAWEFQFLSLTLPDIQNSLPPQARHHPVIQVGRDPKLQCLMAEMLEDVENFGLQHEPLNLKAFCFYQLVLQHYDHQKNKGQHIQARALKLAIDQNALTGKNLSEIMAPLSYRAETLSRLFSENYGLSPIKYLQGLKIRQACILLEKQFLSVKAISEKLGYSSQNYFCRSFKEFLGMSPLQYKNNPNPFEPKRIALEQLTR